jgi:hypothetical protein
LSHSKCRQKEDGEEGGKRISRSHDTFFFLLGVGGGVKVFFKIPSLTLENYYKIASEKLGPRLL